MNLHTWVAARGGIAHREDAREWGYSPSRVRAAIRAGEVQRIRAKWIATSEAPPELRAAAAASGRLTCVSLARRRRWWIPEGASSTVHLQVGGNAHRHSSQAVLHWSDPLVDLGPRSLTTSIEDALAHLARCFRFEEAMMIWESAITRESLDIESLRSVQWRDESSRALARSVRGRSDSGLETVFVVRLRGFGVPIRQQVRLAGHDVDAVIGSHLVIQIDGFAHHSTAADRGRDVAHDAELRMRGYTVLRFTYAQIMHDWDGVERTVSSAVARGLHLPPTERRR
ncbi:endonuclease domain-containing protein [Microbacterium sp.]|uniref:endonuclease domain-containing protein n=1 Tax=Microbacterium sp. TaxID=51671 RepID=UPI002FE265DF